MDQDSTSLPMEISIKDNLRMEIGKDRAAILGQTKATTRVNGWQTK